MAQSVLINGVTYSGVPSVQIPKADSSGNAIFYDTAGADAAASDIMAGKVAYGASGSITGTLAVPSVSQDSSSKVLTIS